MSLISIETLPAEQKHKLWRGIKTKNPGLAELLKSDAVFAELKTRFNGRVLMEESDVQTYLSAEQESALKISGTET